MVRVRFCCCPCLSYYLIYSVQVYYQIEKEQRSERVSSAKVITTGKAALGGPWSLVDSDGIPQTHVIATIKPHMVPFILFLFFPG